MGRTPKPRRLTDDTHELATSAPTDEQLRQVQEWILQGQSEHAIRDSIATEFPGTDPLQLVTGVMDHFLRVATIDHRALVTTYGWCLEATKETYRRILETGEYAGALRAIKQIKELADQASALHVPDGPPQDDPD